MVPPFIADFNIDYVMLSDADERMDEEGEKVRIKNLNGSLSCRVPNAEWGKHNELSMQVAAPANT